MPTGIPIARKGLWTTEEKELLCELYGKIPVKEIARRLGRSCAGIEQQACTKLGLVSAGKKMFIAETKVKYHYNRSFFAADGSRISGPTPRGLDALPTRVQDGKLQVQYRVNPEQETNA